MSKFAYLLPGRDLSQSREEPQKRMEKWNVGRNDLTAKRHLKEPGHPLVAAGKVASGKNKTVNDGPFAEANHVVGDLIVEGADRALAVELAKGCPTLKIGGSVGVRENQTLNV